MRIRNLTVVLRNDDASVEYIESHKGFLLYYQISNLCNAQAGSTDESKNRRNSQQRFMWYSIFHIIFMIVFYRVVITLCHIKGTLTKRISFTAFIADYSEGPQSLRLVCFNYHHHFIILQKKIRTKILVCTQKKSTQ
jgi:hypothetical protein